MYTCACAQSGVLGVKHRKASMSTGCRAPVSRHERVTSPCPVLASHLRAFLWRPQRLSCVPPSAAWGIMLILPVCALDAGMSAAWGGMLAFDALVFTLTLAQAVAARARQRARRDLFSVILYDGALLAHWPHQFLLTSSLACPPLPFRNTLFRVRVSLLLICQSHSRCQLVYGASSTLACASLANILCFAVRSHPLRFVPPLTCLPSSSGRYANPLCCCPRLSPGPPAALQSGLHGPRERVRNPLYPRRITI